MKTLSKHTLKTVCNVYNRLKKQFYRCKNSDVCSMLKQIEEMFGDKLCPPSAADTVGYYFFWGGGGEGTNFI